MTDLRIIFLYNDSSGGEFWLFRAGKCYLADRLKKADLTQEELSEITGISPSSISEYIKGTHKMSLNTAYTIAQALNCYIEELYSWQSVRR